MFIRILFIFFLFFSLKALVFAQDFDAGKLSLSWEVLDTKRTERSGILVALTLINNGNETLPAQGWKVYFNYGRVISGVKGNVKFEFLNGDFNRFAPEKDFKALKPGEACRIEYVASGKAVNFTDAPSGFYLVWDKDSSKTFPLKSPLIKPLSVANANNHITPVAIYNRNINIRDIPAAELIKVFPSPVSYSTTPGVFKLSSKTSIISDDSFNKEANLLALDMKSVFGSKPSFGLRKDECGLILKKVDGLGKEGYQLKVTPDSIVISATEPTGVFYGVQSLKTMFPPKAWFEKPKVIKVPTVEVSDSPRFSYRAFMMDVARNFQVKEEVLKVLDLMSLYKLNVLHFHLNDDEGWRLEIPSLPELTEVGSRRSHTLDNKKSLSPSYGSGPDISNSSGTGYYTKAEFIEILQYAKARHIRVIPEIETPGHARAAIKSMDARYERLIKVGEKEQALQYLLRDINDKSVYRSVQKWNDNVMNVALPSTYTFIEKVIDEIIEMYQEAEAPLLTIHLGGDEVPNGVWEESPAVYSLQKSIPQISSIDHLWYYYFNKVNKILKSKNLYLSGWEEVALRKTILDGDLRYTPNPDFINENFHAYVWNNVWGWGSEDLAYRLANAGYKTILAPVTNFYLDMAYQKDFNELGTYWASFTDIDAQFSFIPFDYYKSAKDNQGNPIDKSIFIGKERLTDFGKSNIVGLQALLWTETVRSKEQFEYLLAPRILAFAERAWSKNPTWAWEEDSVKAAVNYNSEWNHFLNVLSKRELPRLDNYAGGFNYRIPSPGVRIEHGMIYANSQFPDFQIRYTVDGSEPDDSSKLYMRPIAEKGVIKFKLFNGKGRSSKTTTVTNKQLILNKGVAGNNSNDLLKRIDKDVLLENPNLTIIMVGTNDMINSQKLVSYAKFRENYQSMIDRLQKQGIEIILMSPPPVDTGYVFKRHDRGLFKEDLNDKLDSVRSIVKNLAKSNNLHFIDLNNVFKAKGSPNREKSSLIINQLNLGIEDGIHPTKEGYELISNTIYQYLIKSKLLKNNKKIICFGDSITFGSYMNGAGTSEHDTYPALLKKLIENKGGIGN